jgi:hypothetical protein
MTDEISEHIKFNLDGLVNDGYHFNDVRFKSVNQWTYLLMQLTEAKKSLELLKNQENEDLDSVYLKQALFRSYVISYAKNFSSGGKGRVTLNKKEIFKGQNEKLIIHEEVINIRNKFVAHNDSSDRHLAVLAVKEEEDVIFYKHTYSFTSGLTETEFDAYKELIEFVENSVITKINKALDRIQESEGKLVTFGTETSNYDGKVTTFTTSYKTFKRTKNSLLFSLRSTF